MNGTTLARWLVVSIIATATLAPTSMANPWPSDGQNTYNQRTLRVGGPSASRALAGLTKVWERPTGGDVRGTPVTAIGGVFAGSTDGAVYAWLQKNGSLAWATGIEGPVYSSPLVVEKSSTDRTVYAVASKKGGTKLVALDPHKKGDVKWSTQVDSQFDSVAYASPAYSAEKNLVYVATCACRAEEQGTITNTRGTISAVDATTGALVWKQYTASPSAGGVGIAGTPLVADVIDRVYVATGHSYGLPASTANSVFALDTATGAVVGQFQARQGDAASNANLLDVTKKQGFVSPPIAVGNSLGVGSKDGNFYAFDATTMEQKWTTTVGAGSSRGGVIGAGAWDGKALYGSSSLPGLFWSLDGSGGHRWVMPSDDPMRYGPVSVANGVAWSTNSLGLVEARNASDGRPLGRYPLSGPSTAGVSFANNTAYVAIGSARNLGGGVAAFR